MCLIECGGLTGINAMVKKERKEKRFDTMLNNITCFSFLPLSGPIRNNYHLCALWVCQLKLTGYHDWRLKWVFHHSIVMFLSYQRILSQLWLIFSQSLYMPIKKKWCLCSGDEIYAHCNLCFSHQCLHCRWEPLKWTASAVLLWCN